MIKNDNGEVYHIVCDMIDLVLSKGWTLEQIASGVNQEIELRQHVKADFQETEWVSDKNGKPISIDEIPY